MKKRLSLLQRFALTGFIIMVVGTLGVGWWLGAQIRTEVIRETASTSALYMDSFVAPNLQELGKTSTITPEHISTLSKLLSQTPLGQQIVTFKVWDQNGKIIYSSNPTLIGKTFPIDSDLASAWQGKVTGDISNLQGQENVEERQKFKQLLQVYSPVRNNWSGKIIAVAEFYQTVDALQADIRSAQLRTWLAVGLTMLLIYLALVAFVRWTSNTINRQQSELTQQVDRLKELLAQNGELKERVQRAAANTAAVNERFLRRISAELHDGPVQELGAALLRMDRVIGQAQECKAVLPENVCQEQLPAIQTSLQNAIQEVRSLASGLGLPQLESLSLDEVVARVVSAHERRTGSKVSYSTANLPRQADLGVKITVYRIVQEALNNAYNHAGGAGQAVRADCKDELVHLEISDQGPGFDPAQAVDWEQHLGLAGMRERVESLGGEFSVESRADQGARVIVNLPLRAAVSEL